MRLFQPDNFSKISIDYNPIAKEDYKNFLPILNSYFDNYNIRYIGKLEETEINSNNFKIVLEINKQEKIILLRRFKALKEKKQIDFYLRLITELKEKKVKVSSIVENRRNGLVTEAEDGLYAVFEFITADHFIPNQESFISVAEAAAKMHQAFKKLNKNYSEQIFLLSLQNPGVYYNKIKTYTAADIKNIENIVKNKQEKREIDATLLKEFSFFEDIIRQVEENSAKIEKMPKNIIHSDLHPHNILMRGDRVAAIIDFDSIRISQQARDAAFAIYRFGRQFFIKTDQEQSKLKEDARRLKDIFLHKYLTINQLTEEEIKLMPILIKDEFMKKLLFVLKGVYEENNSVWAKDLYKFIMALKEIDYFWH